MKLLVFLLLPCLSLSELVPGFGKCKQFFLNNDPPKLPAPPGTTVQEICQCVWDENDDQKFLYATLYSPTWRIPIYSAYVFKKSESVRRCDVWYIEPQLDDANGDPCMAPTGGKKRDNQAVNRDYKHTLFYLDHPIKYDRGRLYPVQHTYDHLSMLATSTLTNAAPQESQFNWRQWREHEKNVTKDLEDCEDKGEAYVVTGVVPDHWKPKLNNRVTVSKYFWRATCCRKKGVYTGQGYVGIGIGRHNEVKKLSITALQRELDGYYKVKDIVIFPSQPKFEWSKKPKTDVGGCI